MVNLELLFLYYILLFAILVHCTLHPNSPNQSLSLQFVKESSTPKFPYCGPKGIKTKGQILTAMPLKNPRGKKR